jgi:carboxylate-amine ligase
MWRSGRSPESYPNSTRAHYDELIDALVATKAIKDATKIYWDIRPSTKFETLEFRVTDVCTTLDEAVMVAGLTRALARICYARALDGESTRPVAQELFVAANWRASRYGLEDELIDVEERRTVRAEDLIGPLHGGCAPGPRRGR